MYLHWTTTTYRMTSFRIVITTCTNWTAMKTCSRWTTRRLEVVIVLLYIPSLFLTVASCRCPLVGAQVTDTLDRRLRTLGVAHVVTRLAARSITGHALPMEVHQHYDLEFHLLLTDTLCICREFNTARAMRRICAQLERGLEGLCSCVFDADQVMSLPYKFERCVRAHSVSSLCRDSVFARSVRSLERRSEILFVGNVRISSGPVTGVARSAVVGVVMLNQRRTDGKHLFFYRCCWTT